MITIRAVVLGKDLQHALSLAKNIKNISNGELTTLVDGSRVYCSLQYAMPPRKTDVPEKSALAEIILEELSVRDAFEESLIALGCPFTFIDECDTDDGLTLEDMRDCDGSDELLTQLFELETLRDILTLRQDTFRYAAAIDSLIPYIKKSLFSKGNDSAQQK